MLALSFENFYHTRTHTHMTCVYICNSYNIYNQVKDVGKWLESRGMHEYVKVFADNDVNGNILLRLDKVCVI